MRSVRSLTLLGLALAGSPAAAAEPPLVPIISTFHHWHHHWFVTLPGDPVYETVEVASRDRGPGVLPLIWVWFTERAEPKRQSHYLNDARVAPAGGGQVRDISFTMTGPEGGARGVATALVDAQGRRVTIELHWASDQQLVTQGAGLTDQIGHSADRLFLIFFREKNAVAHDWRVEVGGVDVARPRPGEEHGRPFAAYSRNVFVGGFPYGTAQVAFEGQRSTDPDVLQFVPAATPGTFTAVRPDRTTVEIVAAPNGGLQSYRHRDGGHVLDLRFDPPLPPPSRLRKEARAAYRVSIDGFHNLVVGAVRADVQRVAENLFGGERRYREGSRYLPAGTGRLAGEQPSRDNQPGRPGPLVSQRHRIRHDRVSRRPVAGRLARGQHCAGCLHAQRHRRLRTSKYS